MTDQSIFNYCNVSHQKNVPFSEYFQVSPLKSYHRVILMEDFMKFLAPSHWPVGQRKGYCWLPPDSNNKCVMKVSRQPNSILFIKTEMYLIKTVN